jgi:hypothetical protein
MRHKTSAKRNNQESNEEHVTHHARMAAEYRGLCQQLRDQIAAGDLPPDEAYWWTRIALGETTLL